MNTKDREMLSFSVFLHFFCFSSFRVIFAVAPNWLLAKVLGMDACCILQQASTPNTLDYSILAAIYFARFLCWDCLKRRMLASS